MPVDEIIVGCSKCGGKVRLNLKGTFAESFSPTQLQQELENGQLALKKCPSCRVENAIARPWFDKLQRVPFFYQSDIEFLKSCGISTGDPNDKQGAS